MNKSVHRISLDIHDTASQSSINAKKGDTARSIYITLQENSKPYRIAEGCHAVFTGVKPDGNYLFNDCTIKDNVITYDFTEQTVPVVGQVRCEVALYDANNERITSPRFDIIVNDVVYNGEDIVSSDEANALITATAEAKAITAEVEQKLANGEFKGDKGEKGEKGEQGIQGEKGDPGADGKDAVIDQTYNPESPNAQSGTAVAEALANIGGGGTAGYGIIGDITLTEATSDIVFRDNINKYNDFLILFEGTVSEAGQLRFATGFNYGAGSFIVSSFPYIQSGVATTQYTWHNKVDYIKTIENSDGTTNKIYLTTFPGANNVSMSYHTKQANAVPTSFFVRAMSGKPYAEGSRFILLGKGAI